MKIKRTQVFALRSTGKLFRVVSVIESGFVTTKQDLVTIADLENGRIVRNTKRILLSDSLRRRYYQVQKIIN